MNLKKLPGGEDKEEEKSNQITSAVEPEIGLLYVGVEEEGAGETRGFVASENPSPEVS